MRPRPDRLALRLIVFRFSCHAQPSAIDGMASSYRHRTHSLRTRAQSPRSASPPSGHAPARFVRIPGRCRSQDGRADKPHAQRGSSTEILNLMPHWVHVLRPMTASCDVPHRGQTMRMRSSTGIDSCDAAARSACTRHRMGVMTVPQAPRISATPMRRNAISSSIRSSMNASNQSSTQIATIQMQARHARSRWSPSARTETPGGSAGQGQQPAIRAPARDDGHHPAGSNDAFLPLIMQ